MHIKVFYQKAVRRCASFLEGMGSAFGGFGPGYYNITGVPRGLRGDAEEIADCWREAGEGLAGAVRQFEKENPDVVAQARAVEQKSYKQG